MAIAINIPCHYAEEAKAVLDKYMTSQQVTARVAALVDFPICGASRK